MAKIITITFGAGAMDVPKAEGWIIIGYKDPVGGGKTEIGAPVWKNGAGVLPTWASVASVLANNLGRNEWPKEITGKASENRVRLMVPDSMSVAVFHSGWNPDRDQKAELEEDPDFVTIEEEKF